jgi:hypothetical protein
MRPTSNYHPEDLPPQVGAVHHWFLEYIESSGQTSARKMTAPPCLSKQTVQYALNHLSALRLFELDDFDGWAILWGAPISWFHSIKLMSVKGFWVQQRFPGNEPTGIDIYAALHNSIPKHPWMRYLLITRIEPLRTVFRERVCHVGSKVEESTRPSCISVPD